MQSWLTHNTRMSLNLVLACFLFGMASQGLASNPPYEQCKPQLKEFPNGLIDAEMKDLYDPNDRIWYFCHAPYVLDGVQDVTCLPNGEWDHPPPKCVRVYCERRDSPANGSQDPDQPQYEVAQKVTYFCNKFFTLNGPQFAICLPNSEWSHPVPICDAPKCQRPDDPANGNVISKDADQELFNAGQKVWFKCDDGFSLSGAKDFVCQQDGSWRPQPFPKCVPNQCKRPSDPANGHVVSRKNNQQHFNAGEKVWFKCDGGFVLDGGAKDFVCQKGGSWRPQPFPKCVRPPTTKCLDGNSWTPWFDRDDPSYKCDCETLRDLRSENKGKICEKPSDVEAREIHTKKLYASHLPNIKISPSIGFACWNTKNHRCTDYEVRFCCPKANQCKRPSDPANGHVVSRKENQQLFNVHEKVWFKCDDGFVLDGGAKDFVCQKDGSWRPQPFPKCIRPPTTGCLNGNSWTSWFDRDNPSLRCDCETLKDLRSENKGKICEKPSGVEAREIRSKRLYTSRHRNIKISPTYGFACWNTKDHKCTDYEVRFCCPKTNQCERPSDPANGHVVSRKENQQLFNVHEKVWFKCDDGFVLDGGAKDFVCQKGGSWRPQPFPKCIPNQCKRPSNPANGHVVSKKNNQQHFNLGEKVWFKCDDRFVLDGGAKDFVCQKGGSWKTQPFPKCIRPPTAKCLDGNSWTSWFDRDNPSLRCDCETLRDLRSENKGKICEKPSDVEAREIRSKRLYTSHHRNIKISPTYGFACWNTKYHKCTDYEVRFCCPKGGPTHHTVVACEGDFRKYLRCPKGHKIQIVKGFYGRDDRHTCPSKAIFTDKCFAKNSLAILKRHCHNRYSCRLQPSNEVFGDPCKHTFKYIKLTYYCKKH